MENHFNCIYLYTNKINGKGYVGQAVDFLIRHKQHFYHAHNPKEKEYNSYFSRSIRKRTNHDFKKYEEVYSVEILKEDLSTQEELNYWEDYYILEFNLLAKDGKGYNCKLNGINGQIGNPFAGKTDEELAERSRKISEVWKNKSDEEKAERSRKMSEAWKNKSDEELAEISRKISETNREIWKNKSDEEMKEFSKKLSEAWKNKTDEEMKEFSRKRSEINREIWKNKTDEELAEISRKYSERAKKTWKNRTDEERAEICKKLSEAYHNKSDEELAEISKKHSEIWKNKTDEEMKEFSRKMSEINKGKSHATLIDRFDKQGNYVDTKYQFEYVQLGFNACNISACCKGKRKSHKGFIFKYHNEELAEKSRKHNETWKNKSEEELVEFRRKQSEAMKGKYKGENSPCATLVDRFDKQGNYVDTKYQFEYVQLGFNAGNISSCCKGKRKSTGGYVFKYHSN